MLYRDKIADSKLYDVVQRRLQEAGCFGALAGWLASLEEGKWSGTLVEAVFSETPYYIFKSCLGGEARVEVFRRDPPNHEDPLLDVARRNPHKAELASVEQFLSPLFEQMEEAVLSELLAKLSRENHVSVHFTETRNGNRTVDCLYKTLWKDRDGTLLMASTGSRPYPRRIYAILAACQFIAEKAASGPLPAFSNTGTGGPGPNAPNAPETISAGRKAEAGSQQGVYFDDEEWTKGLPTEPGGYLFYGWLYPQPLVGRPRITHVRLSKDGSGKLHYRVTEDLLFPEAPPPKWPSGVGLWMKVGWGGQLPSSTRLAGLFHQAREARGRRHGTGLDTEVPE